MSDISSIVSWVSGGLSKGVTTVSKTVLTDYRIEFYLLLILCFGSFWLYKEKDRIQTYVDSVQDRLS